MLVKYAYTGEVSMDRSRVKGFIGVAKSLQMIGIIENEESDYEQEKVYKVTQKRSKSPPIKAYEDSDTMSDISDDTEVSIPSEKRVRFSPNATSENFKPKQRSSVSGVKRKSNPDDISNSDESSEEEIYRDKFARIRHSKSISTQISSLKRMKIEVRGRSESLDDSDIV